MLLLFSTMLCTCALAHVLGRGAVICLSIVWLHTHPLHHLLDVSALWDNSLPFSGLKEPDQQVRSRQTPLMLVQLCLAWLPLWQMPHMLLSVHTLDLPQPAQQGTNVMGILLIWWKNLHIWFFWPKLCPVETLQERSEPACIISWNSLGNVDWNVMHWITNGSVKVQNVWLSLGRGYGCCWSRFSL